MIGRQNQTLAQSFNDNAQTSLVFEDWGSLFSRGLETDRVLSFNYAML